MSGESDLEEAPWPGYALPRGTTVNGYRFERVLGSGGFGVTYLAHDLLGQRFAIKEYYPRQFAVRQGPGVVAASAEDVALFEECRERFLREAQALVVLGRAADASDGIVRVQTYFEAQGTCFLVMDYVEGASLASVLRQEPGGLAAPRVRSLLVQLLSSLRVVHRAGLMHRDIKPANIILRDDDRAVLIDFGSTRQAARSEATSYTQIYSGGYAPPEQMLGLRQGEYSDIYAIGAVLYRAIGGKVVDALARQNAQAAGRPDPQPFAGQIGAGRYPGPLLGLIDAALAIDPTQRPQSVDAMLAALDRDGSGDEATVVVARRPVQAAAPRKRRGVWVAAAVVGVLLLVGAAGFLWLGPTAPPGGGRQEVAASTPTRTPVIQTPVAVPEPQQPPEPRPVPAETAPLPTPAVIAPPEAPPSTAPSVPAGQPQREAVVVPPLASVPAPVPAPAPEPAPAIAPTPVPAPTIAPSPPDVSPLDHARAAARSVPCSALGVGGGQDGLRVSGFAPAGQDLERLLVELRNGGRVTDDITRIDRFACTPLATVAGLVQQGLDTAPGALAIRLDQRTVAVGTRLAIDIATSLPALYLDLYQSDGTVRHLLRPASSGAAPRPHVEWIATPPPGPRLLIAIGSNKALDLGQRSEAEPMADYLTALQRRLPVVADGSAAAVATITVRAAEPAVAKVPPKRPGSLQSSRCANIVSRAQLGETLSDGELAALRSECRS